ncbi:hypothetical protein B0H16DRAFT_1736137 [Mycena metata]|uniref:Uncharacterized protein n=1 Tax=Mycena metata TaxID=1033252 RepID=A0AAD7HPV2_9AGAR|nr:hypothetical protein B0H16DRAFT_1736137 [Mycena metata]
MLNTTHLTSQTLGIRVALGTNTTSCAGLSQMSVGDHCLYLALLLALLLAPAPPPLHWPYRGLAAVAASQRPLPPVQHPPPAPLARGSPRPVRTHRRILVLEGPCPHVKLKILGRRCPYASATVDFAPPRPAPLAPGFRCPALPHWRLVVLEGLRPHAHRKYLCCRCPYTSATVDFAPPGPHRLHLRSRAPHYPIGGSSSSRDFAPMRTADVYAVAALTRPLPSILHPPARTACTCVPAPLTTPSMAPRPRGTSPPCAPQISMLSLPLHVRYRRFWHPRPAPLAPGFRCPALPHWRLVVLEGPRPHAHLKHLGCRCLYASATVDFGTPGPHRLHPGSAAPHYPIGGSLSLPLRVRHRRFRTPPARTACTRVPAPALPHRRLVVPEGPRPHAHLKNLGCRCLYASATVDFAPPPPPAPLAPAFPRPHHPIDGSPSLSDFTPMRT